MPIPTAKNNQYGGPLVNQKYAPLDVKGFPITPDLIPEYRRLFDVRRGVLEELDFFPRGLLFYASNWELIYQQETAPDAEPPIVVVSSGRAGYLEHALGWARQLAEGSTFDEDVNDRGALAAGATPWYALERINRPDRTVFIFVHRSESEEYEDRLRAYREGLDAVDAGHGKKLSPDRFQIVAWTFGNSGGGSAPSLMGFGPTRFAAIEFCKKIFNPPGRPAADPVQQKAWIVDDNVVLLNNFYGFQMLEQALDNHGKIGIGFAAATANLSDEEIMATLVRSTAGAAPPAPLPAPASDGILQQCAVWDIHRLMVEGLNFSPYFISSNEDTSFTSFLQQRDAVGIYKAIKIFKGDPVETMHRQGIEILPSRDFREIREQLLAMLAEKEDHLEVEIQREGGGGSERLSLEAFFQTQGYPNFGGILSPDRVPQVQAQVIEQLMAWLVAQRPAAVDPFVFDLGERYPQTTSNFRFPTS